MGGFWTSSEPDRAFVNYLIAVSFSFFYCRTSNTAETVGRSNATLSRAFERLSDRRPLRNLRTCLERESRLRADSPTLSPFEYTWNGAIKLTVKMRAMESKHFKMALKNSFTWCIIVIIDNNNNDVELKFGREKTSKS
ncbi:unnamed protein product [Ixodes pacificus]